MDPPLPVEALEALIISPAAPYVHQDMSLAIELTRRSSTAMHPASLTDIRAPNTPAADQVLSTVELAEMILGELSLQDLLIAMRACKTFCEIAKTSKAVMQGRVWLFLDDEPAEDAEGEEDDDEQSDESDESVESDDSGDTTEDEDSHGSEGYDEYDEYDVDNEDDEDDEDEGYDFHRQIYMDPSFKDYLSFTVPTTEHHDGFAFEMIDRHDGSDGDEVFGACCAEDTDCVEIVYVYANKPHR